MFMLKTHLLSLNRRDKSCDQLPSGDYEGKNHSLTSNALKDDNINQSKAVNSLKTTLSPFAEASQNMNQLRKENKLVDVTIVCGDQRFSAHRLMLSSHSVFFRDLFVKDSVTNTSSTLNLEDVEGPIIERLLDYMYTGMMDLSNMSSNEIIQLMTTSYLLQIASAPCFITELWLKTQPSECIIKLLQWSDDYKNLDVLNALMTYISHNFCNSSKWPNFGDLTLDQLMTILTQANMCIPENQDMVFDMILAWVKHNPVVRENLLSTLCRLVNFENISKRHKHFLAQDPILGKHLQLKQMLGMVVKKLPSQTPGKRRAPSTESASTKCCSPKATIIRKKHGSSHSKTTLLKKAKKIIIKKERKSPSTKANEKFPTFTPIPISSSSDEIFSSNLEKGIIVLVAGRDDGNRFVWQCYISNRNSWTVAQELNMPMITKEGFAYHDGQFFVIGGENSKHVKLRDVQVFNIQKQTLRQTQSLWIARASPTIVPYKNFIFAIGGLSRFEKFMTHVECYNINTEMWRILPPIKEKRTHPGVAVIGENIYVIGGLTTRCEYYDTRMETWFSLPSLPACYQQAEVISTATNGKLYTFCTFKPDKVCCYDPHVKSWTLMKTNNQSPENILAVTTGLEHIWFLDKNCKLYLFDTVQLAWLKATTLPHRLNKPQHVSIIKINEFDLPS